VKTAAPASTQAPPPVFVDNGELAEPAPVSNARDYYK
jgi:hypothetical protein